MVEITEGKDAERIPDRSESAPGDGERQAARKRVERKHKFRGDVVAYLLINLFLIGLWAATGFGYFWSGWVLAGWGVLLLLDAWKVYYRRPITEDEIDEELGFRRR
jgi:2TM domain